MTALAEAAALPAVPLSAPQPLQPPLQPRRSLPRSPSLAAPYGLVVAATPLPAPQRLWHNPALAATLGLLQDQGHWWRSDAATAVLAGNAAWRGRPALATVYAGHQFGRFVSPLGDGRALLIAELAGPQGPQQLQLKGAGATPYARGGDGRMPLREAVREVLACEAMQALGIPSTRALSLVGSQLPLQREDGERNDTAAVVCRVAPSFLRFGHFEYFAQRGDTEALRTLADALIAEHFPQLVGQAGRHAAWLAEVVERSARLQAMWQTVGFCHGVMNTDNCSILGLTLDYGPFGFMDRFRAHHVCNASDSEGRYAYNAQPAIGQWNVARLLQACAPLLHAQPAAAAEQARALLPAYAQTYDRLVMQRWAAKLGLAEVQAGDAALLNRWLSLLQQGRCDFSASFRALGEWPPGVLRQRFANPAAFDAWAQDWQARLAAQGEHPAATRERQRLANPVYVLRNHLAQAAIQAAEQGDASELQRLAAVLARPFDTQPGAEAYAAAPAAGSAAPELSCAG